MNYIQSVDGWAVPLNPLLDSMQVKGVSKLGIPLKDHPLNAILRPMLTGLVRTAWPKVG